MPRKARKVKSKDGYIRVPIPVDLINRVDEFIRRSKGRYRYRSEVVRHALVRFLEIEGEKE